MDTQEQTLDFQTEVQQLLNLMIHSLYSHSEIFLRELISNAADAADRLRFEGLTDQAVLEDDPEPAVYLSIDKEARTITVTDNGIGMSREEVVENLGTIARSGTQRFVEAMTGDERQDAQLIGQFGVGFYSAFIVADQVEVHTRRAGLAADHGVRWRSDGKGAYTVAFEERERRGTDVILHLAEDQDEFLEPQRLRTVVQRYSDHIPIPIRMTNDEDEEETVNRASALWMRPKSEISDDEYQAFYQHIAHDSQAPLTWLHNKVEGNQAYTSLLFIPAERPFDLFDREQRHGVRLYVRRVFIKDDTEYLMPRYLRFVRGVIDSDDLPLNISREILQQNRTIDRIRSASTKRVLDALERMSKEDTERYERFWERFGSVLKEGCIEDAQNAERIAALLRFRSLAGEQEREGVTLDAYLERMRVGQNKIYYVTADSLDAARHSPHLEVFRRKGVEVLLLHEAVDEWLVAHLPQFREHELQSVAKGALDLGELGEDDEDTAHQGEREEALKPLVERLQSTLGEAVSEVRVSHRLTESPSCVVVGEDDLGLNVRRMLEAAGQSLPQSAPILEINPDHAIVQRLANGEEEGRFEAWSWLLLEQATLAEGGNLNDPAAFVRRMNTLLVSESA